MPRKRSNAAPAPGRKLDFWNCQILERGLETFIAASMRNNLVKIEDPDHLKSLDLFQGFKLADGSLQVRIENDPKTDFMIPAGAWRRMSSAERATATTTIVPGTYIGLLDEINRRTRGLSNAIQSWNRSSKLRDRQATHICVIMGRSAVKAHDFGPRDNQSPAMIQVIERFFTSDAPFMVCVHAMDEHPNQGNWTIARSLDHLIGDLVPHLHATVLAPPASPSFILGVDLIYFEPISTTIERLFPPPPRRKAAGRR